MRAQGKGPLRAQGQETIEGPKKAPVIAPNDSAVAKGEKKPRGGGRPRGVAPSGEPVDYAAHEVVAPPEGWRREVVPRKSVQGADAYYYSPCGKRMRSKPDVQRFLDKKRPEGKYVDVTIDQFDFSTQPKVSKAPKEDKPTKTCLLYTSPSPRDATLSRMPSSA